MEMPLVIYFAARAPEVPLWFVLQDETPLPPMATFLDAMRQDRAYGELSFDDRRAVESHFHDPCFDLPAELEAVRDGIQAVVDESLAVRNGARAQNEARRFYTWRWSYAENMAGTAKQFTSK